MCEENKRESFPQEAQDPQPIETQAAAPAEVSEAAVPGVEAVPQEGMAQDAAPGVEAVPQQGAAQEAPPVEASETAAPGAEAVPREGMAQEAAPAEVGETAAPGAEAAPQEGAAQDTAPAEVSETAAPGLEAVPPQGAPQQGAPWGWPGPWGWQPAPPPVQGVPQAQGWAPWPGQPYQGQGCPPYQAQPWYGQQPGPYVPPGPWGPGPYAAPQGVPPQGGQPQGVPPQAPGAAPGWQPAPPEKKKLPLALKVFLWVASVLAAGAILGFAVYLGYSASTGTGLFREDGLPELPYESSSPYEDMPYEEDDPLPQEDMPYEEGEEEEELPPQPDVDVTPNNEGLLIQGKPQGDALSAQEVYDKVSQSTVTVEVRWDPSSENPDSSATGIIATSDGYIITNSHVVLNSKSVYVTVTTYDGQAYDAVVVGMDRTTDLAVLKTNDHGFTPAEFGDAEELSIGEWVVAIGNPGGERFSGSMTRGIVSGLDREVGEYSENGMTYIQTDAAVNPGNSGGPLVNLYGQVVGINSSKIVTEHYEGMGFAIPVSKAKDIIDQLLSGGYVEGRVRLGITGTDVSEMQSMVEHIPQGFQIVSIDEDSAFAGTGAQVGDVITGLDGEEVEDLAEISNLLLRYQPGDQVTITLYRPEEDTTLEVEITLLADKGETQE